MTWLPPIGTLLLVLVVCIVVVATAVMLDRMRRPALRIERKRFLTKAELDFLAILRRSVPAHHVSCQVSMGALLKPQRGLDKRTFWRTRNKFGQKIVDFVIIDPQTGSVEAVVELDDASHNARSDRERDAMLGLGHYRIVRVPSVPRPNDQNVGERMAFLRARERS